MMRRLLLAIALPSGGPGTPCRHLLLASAMGQFTDITGSYTLDPATDELDDIDVTIGTGNVDTGSRQRDRDLGTARCPTMHFVGYPAVRTGPHSGRVAGELTLRSVTRPVDLLVTLGDHAATATTSIKRSDFGMRPGLASLFIADRVDIRIEIRDMHGGTGPGRRLMHTA